ncbi:MAG: hypothetical protein KJO54_11530 [Gammaproteobacteria bacterium]|nr:hypothetical protein [Gammaproteobacteria bacterium]NNF60566.1 hypothetical protein [Gammaproteobacteria bacterium]
MPTSENTDAGRIRSGSERVYGVRMTLPPDDPMRRVLGDEWASFRWFASIDERDNALIRMRREHEYSRLGDTPTLVYEKVERDKPPAPLKRPTA